MNTNRMLILFMLGMIFGGTFSVNVKLNKVLTIACSDKPQLEQCVKYHKEDQ